MSLPIDVWGVILTYASGRAKIRCMSVSKTFHDVISKIPLKKVRVYDIFRSYQYVLEAKRYPLNPISSDVKLRVILAIICEYEKKSYMNLIFHRLKNQTFDVDYIDQDKINFYRQCTFKTVINEIPIDYLGERMLNICVMYEKYDLAKKMLETTTCQRNAFLLFSLACKNKNTPEANAFIKYLICGTEINLSSYISRGFMNACSKCNFKTLEIIISYIDDRYIQKAIDKFMNKEKYTRLVEYLINEKMTRST